MPRVLALVWVPLVVLLTPASALARFDLAPGFPWSRSVTGSETATALSMFQGRQVWVAGNVTNPVSGRDILLQVYSITNIGAPMNVGTFDYLSFLGLSLLGEEGPPAMVVLPFMDGATLRPFPYLAFTVSITGLPSLLVVEIFKDNFSVGTAQFVWAEKAAGIAVSSSGTPFVVGSLTADNVDHMLTYRWPYSLTVGWAPQRVSATFWTGSTASMEGRGVVVDGIGNSWIVAVSEGNIWLFKYTPESFEGVAGFDVKARLAHGFPRTLVTGSTDDPRAVVRDGSGDLWVAGASDGKAALWKFDQHGTLLWNSTYPGSILHALVLDGERRGFATGASGIDLLFLGVDSGGSPLPGFPITRSVTEWTGSSVEGRGVGLDADGSVWIAATVTSAPPPNDDWTGTYTKLYLYHEVTEPPAIPPGNVWLPQGGVLDPYQGELIVQVRPVESGAVHLTILTMRGEPIFKQTGFALPDQPVDLRWNGRNTAGTVVAPGVYALRVTGPGLDVVKRVVVMKR